MIFCIHLFCIIIVQIQFQFPKVVTANSDVIMNVMKSYDKDDFMIIIKVEQKFSLSFIKLHLLLLSYEFYPLIYKR